MAINPITTTMSMDAISTYCAMAENAWCAVANPEGEGEARFAVRLMTRQAANPAPKLIEAMSRGAFAPSRNCP